MSKYWNQKAVATRCVKLHNRRVMVSLCNDGAFKFLFINLVDGVPVKTRLALTEEATKAMMQCLVDLVRIEIGRKLRKG